MSVRKSAGRVALNFATLEGSPVALTAVEIGDAAAAVTRVGLSGDGTGASEVADVGAPSGAAGDTS